MHAEFAPGERLAGRYEIIEPLGKGGFAQVYRGLQLGMNRPVAIKIMAPKLDGIKASNHDTALEDFARRFEKEAQVLSTLHDPSTVTVHDYGVTDDGIPYMILELVEGTSLDQLEPHELPMPEHRLVRILMRILESLREAHFLSILHRDIKPSNIMIFSRLGEPDHVKVLDFGMAKIYQGNSNTDVAQETQNGMLIGTPRYMAPELIREPEKAGPGSDLYSLGLVCYELLTGQRAINAQETMLQISMQLGEESLTLPEELDISDALRDLINKMLDKNLATRWTGAQHVINELNQKVIPHLSAPERPEPTKHPNPFLAPPSFSVKPPSPSDDLEQDDASTITLTEEVVVSAVTAVKKPVAPLKPAPLKPAPLPSESLFDIESIDASPSPSGVRMPSRPRLQSSGILPTPPSHSVARPTRTTSPSQQLAVQDSRLRQRIDSSHNVAAPLDPLPLSWDDNEVTPPPAQPDKAELVIVLDSPSGRYPTAPTGPVQVPKAPEPSPAEVSAMMMKQEFDQKWLAIQKRNQRLSALLLLVVLAATLYVIVRYLL